VTIGQVLKTAGYRTAMAGKWRVGDRQPPTQRGFDDFYGFVRGYVVDSWEPRMMTRLPEGRALRYYARGEFFATDAITDNAKGWDDIRNERAARQKTLGLFVREFALTPRRPIPDRHFGDGNTGTVTYKKCRSTIRKLTFILPICRKPAMSRS
jgi:arylsulfatase A-like enzyme